MHWLSLLSLSSNLGCYLMATSVLGLSVPAEDPGSDYDIPQPMSPRPYGGLITPYHGPMHGGHATWFTSTGPEGACLLPPPLNRHFAAMNDDGWGGSWLCGMCVEITAHNGKKVTVMITDQSPGQAGGSLDLSPEAFTKLGPLKLGQIDMSWSPVNCVSVGLATGTPEVVWKPGSSEAWFAIQIRHSALPISSVSIRLSAPRERRGGWRPLPRTNYNFWVAMNGIHANPGPFDIIVQYQDGSHYAFWRIGLNSVMAS